MRAAVSLVAVSLLAATLLAQDSPPPPFEADLGPGPVRLELDAADLDVEAGYSPSSRLRAWAADDGFEAEGLLAVRAGAGGARVTRREPADASAAVGLPRLRLELELAAGQRLAIRGSDLEVRMTTAPLPEDLEISPVPSPDGPPEPLPTPGEPVPRGTPTDAGANPVELTLAGSAARLEGISTPAVLATDSDVRLDGCFGAASLHLTGGVSSVEGHHGPLTVTGLDAEVTVAGSEGGVSVSLSGGSLLARDGLGPVSAQLEEGRLLVDGWDGVLSLGGTGSAEVRRSSGATLTAVGQQLDLLADGWSGLVKAELDGGEIRGGDWSARAELTLRNGARADVDGVRSNVLLKAEQGCAAELRNVGGTLDATVRGGRLDARGVGSLSLLAADADVAVAGVSRVEKADAARSTFDLDLTGVSLRTVVGLGRDTSATIRLSAPCQVRTQGPGAALGSRARVSGCEHRVGNQRWMSHTGRGLDGRRPVQLVVAMAETASVDVDGVP